MTRALSASLALVLIGLLTAASAGAQPGFEYGEVARFGGFDSGAYNAGQYGGALTPGKFLDPTGFAVDPVDNTVYVADRTSSHLANPTSWRIQQLSPTGALLGTTTFTLPNGPFDESYAVEGLAVDHGAQRLYALVVGPSPTNVTLPAARELLAWSTKPDGGGQLKAATGLPTDPLETTGALVSGEEKLSSGATPLYGPQGIAVDPVEAPGVANPIAIEASDAQGQGTPVPGNTVVAQVATQGAAAGDLLARWSGADVASQLGGISWGPRGISASPDGTLTVLMDTSETTATDTYAVKLTSDFSEATALDNNTNVPVNEDFDQSPMYIDEPPFFTLPGAEVPDPRGSGSQVVQLSTGQAGAAGPYAAIMFTNRRDDNQVDPPAPPGSEYWTSGENVQEAYEANIGIRLLTPIAGAISDLQGRTIVNTLGNGSESGPCHIGAPRAALATGADGTLWVLDRGPKADQQNARGQGREVIEFAPNAGQPCPQPSGTFTMTPAEGASESGEETLTVPAGTQVTFDASSINRRHGKPFAYEWDLDGNPTNGPRGDGFEKVYEMQPIHYYYPPARITYVYTRPGEYKVRIRMRTDYGTYAPSRSGTVIVTRALTHPEARFTATPSGQQVTVNATGSVPGVGTIVSYHWNWGDGDEEDEGPQTPVVAHTYAQSGSYPVTLTVTNSSYQSATSAPLMVTVVAPPHPATISSLPGPIYDIPPPALYPIPAPPSDRAPTRLRPHARFGGGALSVTLACPGVKAHCAGTVSVETATAVAAGSRKGAHRTGHLVLGRSAFDIPGGHSATVKVRLTAKGMRLLKSRGRLKVLVIVAARDSLGDPGTVTVGMTLKLPPTRGGRPTRHGTTPHRTRIKH